MKERSVSAIRHPWQCLLGIVALFCLLGISACGGTETARVYDTARVLNSSTVQKAARNVPANVDVYTVNNFTGTQADFQSAVAAKIAGDPNRMVVGIDTLHNYQYVAKGSDVPLNATNIAQATNAFAANYGNGNYTRATVAELNTLASAMRANGVTDTNRPGASPLPWLLPLLIIGGALFAITKMRRPAVATQTPGVPIRPTYQPPQPGREYPSDQGARPLQSTDQPTYPYDQGTMTPPPYEKGPGAVGGAAAGGPGYELGKRQGETKQPEYGAGGTEYGAGSPGYGSGGTEYGTGKKKPDIGGGSTFGKGGADYGTTDTSGGGRFGKGADYGTTDTGGGGTFGPGGSEYDRDR